MHVQDTLSPFLVANSFQLLNSSHPVETIQYTSGGQNIIKFDFPGIHLADISSPEHNKGAVTYSIQSRNALSPGTFINNTAGIFFDGNPAVITNMVSSKIADPNGIKHLQPNAKASIFPNPTNGTFTVSQIDNSYKKATLLNLIGQKVGEWELQVGSNSINVDKMPSGIYMVQLTGEAGVHTEKLQVR